MGIGGCSLLVMKQKASRVVNSHRIISSRRIERRMEGRMDGWLDDRLLN